MLSALKRNELKQRFNDLLLRTKRKRIESLIKWLEETTDFYTAPASTKYHLSTECGLLQHSLNVYDALMGMLEKVEDGEDTEEEEASYSFKVGGIPVGTWKESTIILVALLHDLCKINVYVQEPKNRKVYRETGSKQDSQGRFDWETYMAYTYKDEDLPYGHGEKSVMFLMSFLAISMEERFAIRWHMGAFGLHDSKEENMLSLAFKKYPLSFVLAQADQIASTFMEDEEGNKPGY